MAKKLSERELKAMLSAEKTDSLNAANASKLSSDRKRAIDYYLGDVSEDIPTIPGRSAAVSTDVSDTVDGLLPGLMEVFCGGDEVVRFDPVGPEDIQAAEQESDFVNHIFMQKNPGFSILQTMFKDGLISKTGIVKIDYVKNESEQKETYHNQDEMALAVLMQDPDVEIIEHSPNEDGTHDVTVAKRKAYGCAKVMNVPPEEFGIARRATNIREAHYCFHEPNGGRPAADLIAEGFDEDQINDLPTYNSADNSEEVQARDTVDEKSSGEQGDEGLNKAMRPIRVTEHYVRMDYNGDGKVGLYRVTTGGEDGVVLRRNKKLDIIEQDFMPFAVVHPDPMPHRFFGRSIADKVIKTQQIKTVLTRAYLDAAYIGNNPRPIVYEEGASDSTLDDIQNSQVGAVIRAKKQGAVDVFKTDGIGNDILPMLAYFDQEREWRTGVSRNSQGLDAEALQNQTATAVQQVYNAAQAKLKLIARNFADGIEDLFWLLHAVIRKNGSQPETVRLRNQWVTVDPRAWKSRDDMTITVGLGSGGKTEQIQHMMLIGQAQEKMLMGGLNSIVTPKNLYNTAKDMVALAGKKDVDLYFTDPGDEPMEPPPNPEMVKAQMEMQVKQQEMGMKAQLDERQMTMKAEIEKVQAEADIATQQLKTQSELALAERKFELEREIKLIEAQLKMREHEASLQMGERKAEQDERIATRKMRFDMNAKRAQSEEEIDDEGNLSANPEIKALIEQLRADNKELQKLVTAERETEVIRDPKTRKVIGARSKMRGSGAVH